ncbi:hypothetical protein [Mycobacteroides chelonae]|uniref:hypothetical protein n=1 Tax=Mycobacteroides chelonae TaxID=1774 RepID=UPI0032049F5D
MIELRGIRYAVGTRTAKTMTLVAALFTLTDLGFLADSVSTLAIRAHLLDTSPMYSEAVKGIQLLIFGNAMLAMVFLVLALWSADQQTVTVLPTFSGRWRTVREIWSSPQMQGLRATPTWLFLAIMAASLINGWLKNHQHPLYSSALMIGTSGLLIAHIVALWKAERHMHREASERVNGRVEECRGFDWKRYGARTDLDAFRRDHLDRRWKFPGHMRYPSEAQRFQEKARKHRVLWTVINTAFGIAILALVNQPVIALFQSGADSIWHPKPNLEQPSVLQMYRNASLVLLALIPAFLQSRLGRLDTLATAYGNKEKELRAKQPIRPHRAHHHYRPIPAGRTHTQPQQLRPKSPRLAS